MLDNLLLTGAAVSAFAVSVYCSLAEGALFFYTPSKLQETFRSGQDQERLTGYLSRLERYVFSTIVLNVLSNLGFVLACAALVLRREDGTMLGAFWAVAAATVILLLFAEAMPRALAQASADKLLPRLLPWTATLDIAFLPIVYPLHRIHLALLRLLSDPVTKEKIAEEIRNAALEGEREGFLDEEDASMIQSIIEFRDVEVREIMTPRTEMACLELDATIQSCIELVVECGHSRIPVYKDSRDQVVGLVYAKDILSQLHLDGGQGAGVRADVTLKSLLRPPFFVPITKPTGDLLKEFRQRTVHLAVVLDEYGGTAGIVTIEDILEEIVGEIEDEYDEREPAAIRRVDAATAEVDAKLHLSELNKELGLEIPEDGEYETVGGFVMYSLGKVPAMGEALLVGDVRITILDSDSRRINRIRVEQLSGQLA